MAMLRGTFMYSDDAGSGWSETIYVNVANLTLAIAAVKRLIKVRVPMLGLNSQLDEVRVSDEVVKRDSQIYIPPVGDRKAKAGAPSLMANVNLTCRLEGGDTFIVRRTLALRGLPNTAMDGPAQKYVAGGAFDDLFDKYLKVLKDDHWAIRYRNKLVPVLDINNVTQAAVGGICTITTDLPHNFIPGQTVFINGVNGARQVNGLWIVLQAPTALTFQIQLQTVIRNYTGGGKCSVNAYLMAEVNNGIIIRSATHRAGRPSGQLRGRRRGFRRI